MFLIDFERDSILHIPRGWHGAGEIRGARLGRGRVIRRFLSELHHFDGPRPAKVVGWFAAGDAYFADRHSLVQVAMALVPADGPTQSLLDGQFELQIIDHFLLLRLERLFVHCRVEICAWRYDSRWCQMELNLAFVIFRE